MADSHGPRWRMFRSYWNMVIGYQRCRSFRLVRQLCLRILRSDEFPRWYCIASSLLLAYHDYHPRARVEVAFRAIEEIETQIRESGMRIGPMMMGLRTWAESIMRFVEQREARDERRRGAREENEQDRSDSDRRPAFGPDTRPMRQTVLTWFGLPWWELVTPSLFSPIRPISPISSDSSDSPIAPTSGSHQFWQLPDGPEPYQSPHEPFGPGSGQHTG